MIQRKWKDWLNLLLYAKRDFSALISMSILWKGIVDFITHLVYSYYNYILLEESYTVFTRVLHLPIIHKNKWTKYEPLPEEMGL